MCLLQEKGLIKSESPNMQKLELRGLFVKLSEGFCTHRGKAPGELGKTLYSGYPGSFAISAPFSLSGLVVGLRK